MSAFDAPIFDEAAIKEIRTGKNQLVALSIEEAAKYEAMAKGSAIDFVQQSVGIVLGVSLCIGTCLYGNHLILNTLNMGPVAQFATACVNGSGTLAMHVLIKKGLEKHEKRRRTVHAILATGYRPLADGEVLPPDRKAVSAVAMIRNTSPQDPK